MVKSGQKKKGVGGRSVQVVTSFLTRLGFNKGWQATSFASTYLYSQHLPDWPYFRLYSNNLRTVQYDAWYQQ